MRLTYANVVSTICLFVLLGGGAYAATHIKRNSVRSKQIKDGAIQAQDIADGAITAGKLAPEAVTGSAIDNGSITGADVANDSLFGSEIDESSLQGVNAARVDGFEVKKVNFQVTSTTPVQNVLVFPGVFRITAGCTITGDVLDITAFTSVENTEISTTTVSTSAANDLDGARDLFSNLDTDFDVSESFALDATSASGRNSNTTVHFATPDGFAIVVHLQAHVNVNVTNTCDLTGTAIAG